MLAIVRVKLEDGVFIPLDPVPGIKEGDVLAFRLPDPAIVYLCETDRLAAIERGQVVVLVSQSQREESTDV